MAQASVNVVQRASLKKLTVNNECKCFVFSCMCVLFAIAAKLWTLNVHKWLVTSIIWLEFQRTHNLSHWACTFRVLYMLLAEILHCCWDYCLVQRVWCAVKAQKKIFRGQGTSTSYLKKMTEIALLAGSNQATATKVSKPSAEKIQ